MMATTSRSGPPPAGISAARTAEAPRPQANSPVFFGDIVLRWVTQGAALVVVLLALLLAAVLIWKSLLAIETLGLPFFYETTWDPEPSHREFGALAFVFGTLTTSLIAMFMAVPLGVGTAAYLSEIAPAWLRRSGSFLVEMLAAIPSVVYGFWGLFVLVPILRHVYAFLGGPNTGGMGILSAGLILSIMIVPYVAAVSFDVCRAVPRAQREAALALGATRWQTIWSVVLPYARPGIIGGCFLALGRALGETMAVTMLIGNKAIIAWAPVEITLGDLEFTPFALGNTIASVIANEFTEAAYDLYLSALVELGLVLLMVSVVVNSLARVLLWRMVLQTSRGPSLLARLAFWRRAVPLGQVDMSAPPPELPHRNARNRLVNVLMTAILGACLLITIGFLFLILAYLVVQGIGALDWDFFTKLPVPAGEAGGGMANALVGSALMVGMATLFAVPVGLLAAIYLSEYRRSTLGPCVRFIGELLVGVPSIVIGIFVYTFMVRPLGHFSGWAGAFALAVIMIPIVMRASEEALKLVPQSLRQASYALGATQWQTVVRVVIPAALPAIITAVCLAVARVAGETAPLLLTAGGNTFWPHSLNDFTPSLPVFIFDYSKGHVEDWHRQAWAAALVLLVVVMLLNFGIRVITGKRVVLAAAGE
jgi:phosphate transport system permease protein